MYSMCRKSEVLRARWREFDLEKGQWDLPAERMKMKQPHCVYLSRQAVELLTLLKALGSQPQACVFPSILRSSVPLGEATLNHFFKRLDFGVPDFSPHGTRGTAATLLREHGLSRDVVELLLAHAERNKVKRSFVRMFNTLQLNTHFISVIARTRLDHDDIGKIEAAIRAQTEAATASLNKAIDGADALFNAHGITSAASYDITDAETEQAPGSSTEGDVGVMNEAAAAPMVTSETGAEVPFAVEE